MDGNSTRRDALLIGLGTALAAGVPMPIEASGRRKSETSAGSTLGVTGPWKRGLDGQRRADLVDGTYINPVLAGDHPDPSVLKDGRTYYKVSSSFDYYPGLVIWQSRDLVNWTPVGPSLHKVVGTVLAPDLVKHDGRYFIYFAILNVGFPLGVTPSPYGKGPPVQNYVIHADSVSGPWSDPIALNIFKIDPGHVVGEDGKRYLFLADGYRVRLTDDGLKTDGKLEKVYDGWPIPKDWVIEAPSPEGPKFLHRDGWIYMITAQGGTGGPPTGHMVIVARSRSIHGPWENCPYNPIVRTVRNDEPWFSRGHATPVEGPNGDWWLIYHGYENGYRTLGRQMLLEPMEWAKDGWPIAKGGDLSRPMRKPVPAGKDAHGISFSGPFAPDQFGPRLTHFVPGVGYESRVAIEQGMLRLTASGDKPADSTLLVMDVGDHRYSVTAEIELRDGAEAGLLLFYHKQVFCGLSAEIEKLHAYRMGAEAFVWLDPGPAVGARVWLRVVNNDNVASFDISPDGRTWRTAASFEVAGYNHNVFDQFLSLRPAIYAARKGSVLVKSVRYQAL